MFYIFNTEGCCVAKCNLPPDIEDCKLRNEVIVESDLDYSISSIKLNNSIIEEIQEDTTLTQNQISTLSKQNRDSAVDADILFDNVYFQVSNDCADIKSSLQEATILGLEDSYSQLWRLADNTWRQTTIAEAKQIVALFVERKQKVWAAFAEWDLGDKSSVFTYEEPFIENTTNSVVQETSQTEV